MARLEEPFSEEPFSNEVFDALLGFNGDKAPGLDGFSMAFWQFSWKFVKDEIIGFFKEFHEHDRFVKNLNATLLG